MTSAIYLSGTTITSLDTIGPNPEPDWRSLAMTRLQRYGFQVLNPLDLTWSSSGLAADRDRNVRRALDLIAQCDAVLANVTRPSYGTAMEIFYAHRQGKMVTVIGQSPFSPWVLSHSQARFPEVDQAVEFLIGEQPHLDPVHWALQFEGPLAQRYEELPADGEPDYRFFGGDLPVLVVAPHSTAYFRDGEFQEPDSFTGSMAALLNRMARCHALTGDYCLAADPCWHNDTPMRRAFADIVRAGDIGLVLFILGSPWHESPGLYATGFAADSGATSEDLASVLRLKLSELEPVASEPVDRLVAPLLRFAVEGLSVPTIALRMHKRYRMPRLQPDLFAQTVDLLAQFIAEVGADLLRIRS